ncbi:MAG: hypothetical protein KAT05_03360 [Spirochaetes bacterium]|nr:hypothetical protein [Spirochaetota bacterium]
MYSEKVTKLQNETGCDPILGKLLLKFTDDDIEGAIKIIKSVDKDIFVIRGKFIGQSSKCYGTFLFFYDSRNKVIDKINIIIKHKDKTAVEFNFDKTWSEFLQDMINYLQTNATEAQLENRFTYQIKNHRAISVYEKTIVRSKEYDEKFLKSFFIDVLFNITGDPNVAIKLQIDRTNAFEVNKGNIKDIDFNSHADESKKEEKDISIKDKNFKKQGQDVLVLNIEPELAPVDGVEITEINPDDLMSVKIVDERPVAEYIASLLNAKNPITNENLMILVRVKDIINTEEGFLIKIEFGPGIFGIAYFGENVKIRMRKKEESALEDKELNDNIITKNFWVIGGILVVAIIMILLWIVRP